VSNGTKSVVLRCHTDRNPSSFIGWKRRLVGDTTDAVLAAGCGLLSEYQSVYSVISEVHVEGQCDLTINTVDTSLTGIYKCVDFDGETASAYVTVVGELFNILLYSCLIITVIANRTQICTYDFLTRWTVVLVSVHNEN